MDQMLEKLVRMLISESSEARNMESRFPDRRMLLRALMNIRMPAPYPEGFIAIQDMYLSNESNKRGIISWESIPDVSKSLGADFKNSDRISLWKGDITVLSVDAIVNAANSQMLGCFAPCHSCIDNAIHSASGLQLRDECHRYMQKKEKLIPNYLEPTGNAVVTGGYNLPSRYVIHTVGPIVSGTLNDRYKDDLRSSYTSCLNNAVEHGIRTIAFCCISTGVFGFPKEEAAKIAIETVRDFMDKNPDTLDRVIFNVFGEVDLNIYTNIFLAIQ